MTSVELKERLAARYSQPEWFFVPEVPNGTGTRKSRTIDGMAFGVWGQNEVHAFEIKVSRSDWLRELDNPSKAAFFAKHCHRFFIVADSGVVKAEELPAEWGLMEPSRSGLKIRIAATLMNPERPDFPFIASIIRRIVSTESRNARSSKEYAKGIETGRKESAAEAARLQKEIDQYRTSVAQFEEAAGIRIPLWDGGRDRGITFRQYETFIKNTPEKIESVRLRLRGHIQVELQRLRELMDIVDNKDV